MIKVFLDTNVVLDLVIESRHGFGDACDLLKKIDRENNSLVCSWHTLAILEYVGRKTLKDEIYLVLKVVVDLFEIPETGNQHAKDAFNYLNDDYEDAMQMVSALAAQSTYIVTNDQQGGFDKSPLTVLSVKEYLKI